MKVAFMTKHCSAPALEKEATEEKNQFYPWIKIVLAQLLKVILKPSKCQSNNHNRQLQPWPALLFSGSGLKVLTIWMIIWQITDHQEDSEDEGCLYQYLYNRVTKTYNTEPSYFKAGEDGQRWRHYNQRSKTVFSISLGGSREHTW